jgi:hypothetical protein
VSVLGQKSIAYGSFKIANYQIEEQFSHANVDKLTKLAERTGGKLFHNNEIENVFKKLLENKAYYTVQKTRVKEQDLIDWKWILFFIISLFTAEWFIRKYFGKI